MELEVSFDQNQSSLPSGFVAAVNYVVGYFDSLFTNNVTVTIGVGYGEIAGQRLGQNALGESEQINVSPVSYSAVRGALVAMGAPGSSTLPASSPTPGTDALYVASTDEKALGLIPDNTSLDGYVGFTSTANTFSYATNLTPPANEYYFIGVVEHEFTEVMGRDSYLDEPGQYSAMDLYRYAAANTRQFTTGAPSYFSINGGATNLDSWNNFQTGNSGDLGDWAPSAGNDAFDDNSSPGVINSLGQTDITVMNAIGWQTAAQPTFFLSQNITLNIVSTPDGSNLAAPVNGDFNLEVITSPSGTSYGLPSGYQGIALLSGTGAGQSITLLAGSYGAVGNSGGDLIAAGSGDDTIGGVAGDTLSGGTGTQFLDGSAGSEFVTGGAAGSETIWGGAGDTVNGGGSANETIGGARSDTITGGTGGEFIDGTAGSQSIIGGSAGNETIWAGAGDTINGGSGANVTIGGVPFDTIIGGTGTEFADGSTGNQSITGGSAGSETIWGGAGDILNGGGNANVTIGGAPNDTIDGGSGSELLDGWKGDQAILGGSASETIGGGIGDTITGGTSAEFINGTGGSQSITGGSAGNETIWSGARDTIGGGTGANLAIGGVPGDTIAGGSGTVFVDASTGNQSVTAGSGSDTIWGGPGDTIAGGSGAALIGLGAGAEFVGDNGTPNGTDTVAGFNEAAGDRIFFPNESPGRISAVLASATTVDGNTTITFADGSTLTLDGIGHVDSSYFG
ncbi:MAG TPA: NF038122 family metalloprotease [Stellaceae bacterium]|nr:NF038122 family metalloprotease [Stellaceae bacterium]